MNIQSKKNKLVTVISFLTIAMAFALLVIVFYWVLKPYKLLVINERPLPVMNKVVKRGDTVNYVLDYCKYTDKQAVVSKKFSDGIEFALPDYRSNNPEGCRTQIVATEVPHTLPEGKYILIADYTYQVNPIRWIVVRIHTQVFEVIE